METSNMCHKHSFQFGLVATVCVVSTRALAQDPPPPPPPPPPAPSSTSFVGEVVTNPAIDPLIGVDITTVSELETSDHSGASLIQFVFTQDQWAFMVQPVGASIYKSPELFFEIISITPGAAPYVSPVASIQNEAGDVMDLLLWQTRQEWEASWNYHEADPGVFVPPDVEGGANGMTAVYTGSPGAGGRSATLFWRPENGHVGHTGPATTIMNTTTILSTNRVGYRVASQGGNGGQGGNSYFNIFPAGDGGNGGVGGTVTFTNDAQIATQSDTLSGLHGIFAYSQSGQGGPGGTGYIAPVGGTGGASPNGGSVSVTNNALVSTESVGGHGIYALSVSGNAGGGGSSWGLVGAAGSGGLAGDGGPVSVTNSLLGTIITNRDFSHGISAQSIGGTGGSGGTSGNLLFNLPSQGQAGGNGGSASVQNDGVIWTYGNNSRGVQAMSNGGGGGDQGGSYGLVALGGQSGAGGNGGTVQVTNSATGTIETRGTGSDAIYAQSVGGSGGSAGDAYGLVALGGSGAVAGNGGAVTVENFGTIRTTQADSTGIFAESIGGGGGDGGSSGGMVSVGGRGGAGGFASTVAVTNGGSITTSGDNSGGIFAQSVGGGGGNGGSSGSVSAFAGYSMGGSGGGGGNGGAVNILLQGNGETPAMIATTGEKAKGVFAQSVGGGGGTGGGSVQVAVGAFGAAAISIGGSGGTAAAGGDVTLSAGTGETHVQTNGAYSDGIMLQSVGGSGGDGGLSVAVAVSGGPAAGSLSVAQGGRGGAGGAAGTVRAGEFTLAGDYVSSGFNGSIQTDGEFSTGLLAQSVGGGGGNAGLTVGAAGAGGAAFAGAVAITLGADGGGAGHGGVVQIGTSADITTLQDKSIGLLAQSVGGGGGNGGATISATLAGSAGGAAAGQFGMGGAGGEGGAGGRVTLATRSSRIETSGSDSAGVIVQSGGGGGGTGGYSVSTGGAGAAAGAGALSIGIGGTGGSGGAGAAVVADLQTDVTTHGDRSAGILAQSTGGGGGAGGYNVSVAAAGSTGNAASVAVGLGGTGGGGGGGGEVTLTSTGSISTEGTKSNGISVQSVGGGGGTGGYNVSVGAAGAAIAGGALTVGLGGSGGTASHGGLVTAEAYGEFVTTTGSESIGVLAQSVGGGGGDGGYNVSVGAGGGSFFSGGISVGLGGSGGGGGSGGEVRLTVSSDIETSGNQSGGVLAQSVGKGGGAGGSNVSVAGAALGAAGAVSVGLGGSGGGGGDGGLVTATSSGRIHTVGDKSNAFTAQSVGGGGGAGGSNVDVVLAAGEFATGAVGVGLGGAGAVAGHGGVVWAEVTGDIHTEGQNSIGILAESVGGGGGDGGFNVTVSGAVAMGMGSGSAGVGLGGSAGGGGNADLVTLAVGSESDASAITINGSGSMGVVAQSVGGGGGNGGFNVSAALSVSGAGTGAVGVGLGGSGGAGGNGGVVNSTVFADIFNGPAVSDLFALADPDDPVVDADVSGGVLAQSLGGGGGTGAFNVTGAVSISSTGAGAAAVGIGGMGGDGGSGANVTNSFTGTVETSRNGGFGVAAQSVGGGGGIGGINVAGTISGSSSGSGALAFGLGGFGGGGGRAGEVDNTVNTGLGVIHTMGDDATGVLSQSIGGGGGAGATNFTGAITVSSSSSGGVGVGTGGFGGGAGIADLVTSHVSGGVVTDGATSKAILSQSIGGKGGAGGTNVTGAVNLSKSSGGTLGVGLGGFGGDGGNAGAVESTVSTNGPDQYFMTSGTDSSAIVAQSVGGDGGVGGTNFTGALSLTGGSTSTAVGVGVGGFGGGGGNASSVLLNVSGDVITRESDSHGIAAQSVGGDGGIGGINITGSFSATTSSNAIAASVGIGGFGGLGGDAGTVEVNYSGTLVAADALSLLGATGSGSHGIAAESLGGGGGIGGMNVSAGVALVGTHGYGGVIGVGGFGGGGGNAETVLVNVTGGGSITSYGEGTSAILAHSIGGGGGDGGMNISGGITAGNSLFVGVGGFAGDAGIAKAVTVNAVTDLIVHQTQFTAEEGEESESMGAGLFAQSVGGGGGNGGTNVTGGIGFSGASNTLTFGMGGFGGAGAAAGAVDVTLTGDVESTGKLVHGILGQSIGGGGGTGGLNVSGQVSAGGGKDVAIVAGVGGSGGTGADSGQVDIIHSGSVTTFGDSARAVFGQSVGGGGGVGGMNVTGLLTNGVAPITVGVGGTGGDAGGLAGAVHITRGSLDASTGRLTTTGSGAHAIEASSIGGGGGDAGMNFVGGVAVGVQETVYAASFVIGGSGGESGSAGAVEVNNFSAITTNLDGSNGVLAQSIGAGGGNGNYNMGLTAAMGSGAKNSFTAALTVGGQPGDGGMASTVDVVQVGDIDTYGGDSHGILAQSIGGGGGNIGLDFNVTLAMGAENATDASLTLGKIGGTGGSSAAVTLDSAGVVHTRGAGSKGLLAQSIGAGGGTSSSTTAALGSTSTQDGKKTTTNASVSVGREGGEGGSAGGVTVDATGAVVTEGEESHAILAQSVGGGGGTAGSASTLSFTGAAPTVGIAVGGSGGAGGASGKVSVTSSADLVTGYSDSLDSLGAGNSIGILAQSIGGGGGTAGDAWTGGIGYGKMTANVAVGGSGGTGNASETVDVWSSGQVWTDGVLSHGILAQSIGGGGGNAGMVLNVVVPFVGTTTEAGAGIASVLVGGAGGDGAIGREVSVFNSGSIITNQSDSIGILAQSIGGGGGNASAIYSGTLAKTTDTNVYSFAIGASGGTGGTGADVLVENLSSDAEIITLADRAHGIYAMSLGGGGGTGSDVISVDLGVSTSNDSATNTGVSFALGGNGAEGGSSGLVTVLNEGLIATHGANAHGIIAQSVGGGGGSGGFSVAGNVQYGGSGFDRTAPTGVFAIGGSGGSGNSASAVTVTNTGAIEVFGDSSYGVYAQSVGGGGGDGGFAAALTPNVLTINPFQSLTTMGLGGFGGSGADGGAVTVDNTGGTIISHGDDSFGIYAQSVGGGGGNMGYAIAAPAWIAANLIIQQTIGGGSEGRAGAVDVYGEGNITMLGDRSNAVFKQSVSGGGGNVDLFLDVSEQAVRIGADGIIIPTEPTIAGWSVLMDLGMTLINHNDWIGTAAGAVTSFFTGDSATEGESSVAEVVQSVSGGGGSATEEIVVDTISEGDFSLDVGGTNVENGDGGTITDTRDGDLTTLGNDSIGAIVQSIGGGGGSAIINVTTVVLPDHAGGSAAGASALGGDGTIGSDGGSIGATYAGAVATQGALAPGLLLQSIGAGGGHTTMSGFDSVDATIGGKNLAAGNGDNISLNNVGSIDTSGTLSHGVVLQSIGGGGGAFFSDANEVTATASADNSGNGGNIAFTQTGDVTVQGDGAIGILAQSLGGGGGFINSVFMNTAGGAGNSGSINLEVDGDVAAMGTNGIGIFAQSRGATGQGNIDVQFAATRAVVVGDSGVGIELSGGHDNTLVNDGIVFAATTLGSPNGIAIRGSDGNETVANNGILYGDVNLGSGNNALTNAVGASTYAGRTLFIGESAAESFTNHGHLSMGDTTTSYTTALSGSYVQTATGELDVSIDATNDGVDLLHITHTAALEGRLNILLVDAAVLKPGVRDLTFLIADGGIVQQDFELVVPESAVAQFAFVEPPAALLSTSEEPSGALMAVAPVDPNELAVQMAVNFAGFGALNSNQSAIGSYIDRVQDAGSSPALAPLIEGIIVLPTANDLAAAYNSMSPEVYTSSQRNLEQSSTRFVESMLGCNQLDGTYKVNARGEAIASDRTSYLTVEESPVDAEVGSHLFWVSSTAGFYNSHQTDQSMGFRANTVDFSAGVEWTLADQWYLGAALGYTNYSTSYTEGISATSQGNSGQIGAYIAKELGSTRVSIGVAAGLSDVDVDRYNIFPGGGTATGDLDEWFIATRLRVSQNFQFSDWYIRPFLDLGFACIQNNGMSESGAGAMNLVIDAGTYNVFTVSPTVQVGWDLKCGGITIRPNASVGYTRYSNEAPSFSAAFAGSPGGVTPFEVYGLNDLNYLDVAGGLDFEFGNSAMLQFVYSGQFSTNTDSSNVQLKLSLPF